LIALGGCGASYRVALRNETGAPIQAQVVEVFATSESTDQLRADIAAGGTFRYVMVDGRRAVRRFVRITGTTSTTPMELEMPPSGTGEWTMWANGGAFVAENGILQRRLP
jgi:hypothetical protein